VVLGIWHLVGLRWAYKQLVQWDEQPGTRFVILTLDIMLWFVLVNFSAAYYFALFGLFIQIFRHLPIRYAAVASMLVTTAMVVEQLTDAGETMSLTSPIIWLFLFMSLASLMLGIWISAIIGQSAARRQLIVQLETTQAELVAAERREGVLEERQRLTHEIHDTLAQGFTSIIMHLEAADQALQNNPAALQKHLYQARSTARTSLDEARRVLRDLRPDLLEQGSLVDAIKRTTRSWQEETGISVSATSTGNPISVHSTIEVTLLRATQEALNNIRKHAQATDVQVTLSYMRDIVMLDIQDNGVGIADAEPSAFSGGFGLQAMRERVKQCGGSVTLESDPGEGTTVVITIPL
jgi:signal transduction histidine kinase